MSIIRQRKKRVKMRAILIASLVFVFLIIILFSFNYYKLLESRKKEDTNISQNKVNSNQAEQLQSKKLWVRNNISDDLRLHNYNYIKLPNKLTIGDFIDIRISFSNGMDFIVLSKKKIVDLTISNPNDNVFNDLWIEVSEEEILRMSSAFVDTKLLEGSLIYAISYLDESQKTAIANYPTNESVKKLIDSDPNIIDKGVNLFELPFREDIETSNPKVYPVTENDAGIEEDRNENIMEEQDFKENITYLD